MKASSVVDLDSSQWTNRLPSARHHCLSPRRMPSFGVTVRSSQADIARSKASLTGKANLTSDTSVDGWDAIALEYSIDWPMQLFFTQEVLSKYLKVFQYLIRLKRTQMESHGLL